MQRRIIAGILLILCTAVQAHMESHLAYRRYTTQDGLPQLQTERVWQDSRGYIYIGTLSGFVRFDGREFAPYLKGRRENIVAFAEIDGRVSGIGFRRQWVIDGNDVTMHQIDPHGYWQLNNLNALCLPDGYAILEDEQEQHRRLCRVTQQGFIPVMASTLLDEMTPDRKLYKDSLCTMFPTAKGLYRVKHGDRHAVRLTEKGDIYSLLRTDSAMLAFASDGIYRVEEASPPTPSPKGEGNFERRGGSLRQLKSRVERIVAADWSAAAFGLTVRSLRHGGIVIADEHSVYLYDGASVQKLVTGINLIRDILVDRWNRLWVATYQGAYCFFNRSFTNYRLTDENDIVRGIASDEMGDLFLGSLNGKLLMRGAESDMMLLGDDDSQYYSSATATIGQHVFMTCHNDVACIKPVGMGEKPAISYLGLPQDRYRFLTRHDGRLILVSQKGVISTYDPDTKHIDTLTTKIPYPWCVAYDCKGTLWAGGTMGVYSLNKKDEVSKVDFPQRLLVTTMDADRRGIIFFASADSLFMIKDGAIEALNNQLPELAGHEIRSLHVSPHGYLIIAAVDGLLVCRIGKNYQLHDVRFFDHRNGFTILEPQMGTIAETPDGTVWLAGVEEMTSFKPADLFTYSEEDTYIQPLPRWWQHWWVWMSALLIFGIAVWLITRGYEKQRNHRKMIRLQGEKLERERTIESIRRKAIEAESTELAKDIVRMTEKTMDEKVTFRTASGTIVVELTDIAYFKGDGNYSQVVTFYSHDTVLIGLGALEKMLDSETFVRADRSTLVNIHNISSLLPKQRRCIFRSANGQEVETKLLAPAFKRLQQLL